MYAALGCVVATEDEDEDGEGDEEDEEVEGEDEDGVSYLGVLVEIPIHEVSLRPNACNVIVKYSWVLPTTVVLEHEWAFLWTEIEHVWHCFIFDALCAENMTTCKTCSISVHKNNHEWSNTIIIFQN